MARKKAVKVAEAEPIVGLESIEQTTSSDVNDEVGQYDETDMPTMSLAKDMVEEHTKKYGELYNDAARKSQDMTQAAKGKAPFPLTELNKANVWAITEQELFDMYIVGKRQDSFSENEVHYMNLIRPVFEFIFFDINKRELHDEYERNGYSIFSIPSTSTANAIAIRRRPIKKITDLTMENIYHVQPTELLRLIDENMGTGWQGLPLYLQDIITTGFYVDCSVMPEFALHRTGGIIEKRKEDGYEILEITRGSWIEAVFVKVKPKADKPHFEAISDKPTKKKRRQLEDDEEDDEEYEDDEELDDEEELDDAEEEEEEDDEMDEHEPDDEDLDMVDSDSEDE